jgi:phospholipid/cholesterol/gamma-HCH transport system substrate-binding protein
MNKSRLEWKVGLFVFVALVLLGALLIEFSKGLTLFRKTYDIYLRAANVGGLKTRASVLMSGVQIGTVSDIRLAPDGKTVTIILRIYQDYQIHKDATFAIEQSGFLGDNYVAIIPTKNEGDIYHNQETAEAEPPFNLQQFTRTATGFITRIDDTVKRLNDALVDVSRIVLNPETLTNLSEAVSNLRDFSDRALMAANNFNVILATNGPSLAYAGSNLVAFTDGLNHFSDGLNNLLATNTPDINQVVKNIESSSEVLKSLLNDVQAGKGLAGDLLKNEEIATNVSQIVSNLSMTSSNLNRLGLWGILWQHKPPKTNQPSVTRPLATPKNPYD